VTLEKLVELLNRLYPESQWPKPFPVLKEALRKVQGFVGDTSIPQLARESGLTKLRVQEILSNVNPMAGLFGSQTPAEKFAKSARQMLGNLIVGHCAERIFVERYKREAATNELALHDQRQGRTDTDYRLHNGKGRPVYRINIKFVGSQFRRAKELVGLEPADCFALATYKIRAALEKQTEEKLPFLFIVVSVPGLSAEEVGGKAPEDMLELLGLVAQAQKFPRKRDVQDSVVEYLESVRDQGYIDVLNRIEHGNWYVLSARRADNLLHEKLFERVYALSVRGFASHFRGAEVDMHFSLSKDLTPLDKYLHDLRERGYPVVTTLLERGDW
jgi:hypothetical protein